MELTLDQALQKGIEAHKAGQVQEADRWYTAILKADPKHPDANHNMGVLAVSVDKVEVALPFFKTALEVNSTIEQFWLSYIDALIKLDRTDDAKALFEKAKSSGAKGDGFDKLEEHLKDVEPLLRDTKKTQEPSEEKLQHVINLYSQGELQQALDAASLLLKQFTGSVILYNIQGAAYAGLGFLNAAVESYEKAINIKPDCAEAHYNLGISLQEQGKLIEAQEMYNQALAIKPDYSEAYNNMGNTLKAQGKLGEAVDAYTKALSIKSDYAEAYNNMGISLQEQGKLAESIETYNQALAIKPDYAEAFYNMGISLKEQGKLEEAIDTYTKALAIKPDYAETYNNLGVTLQEQGKLEEAIDAYTKALSIKPDYAETYNNLGVTIHNQGELKEAIEAYKKALAIKPCYAEAWNNIMFSLQALKSQLSSREELVSYYPRDTSAQYYKIAKSILDFRLNQREQSAGNSMDRILESIQNADDLTIRNPYSPRTSSVLKPILPDKVIALTHFGRSGTGLLHSLIDGHPEVSTLPSIYLSEYFDHSTWEKIKAGGWSEMPARFLAIYEVLFDSSSTHPVETKNKQVIHSIGKKEGMANVGENRNEALMVDKKLFIAELNRLMDFYDELDAFVFFKLVHVAFQRAINDLKQKNLIFYHIHNPDTYAQLNFVRLAQTANWVMMVRDPIQSCESWISDKFQAHDYSEISTNIFTMLFEVDNIIYQKQKSIGVRLEDLKENPCRTVPALCNWLGIKDVDSLYKMTAQGKKWWGDPVSPDYHKDGMNPFGKTSINRKVGSIFSKYDQFILRTLFYPFSVQFGYVKENFEQFTIDLQAIGPKLNEMFDFEKVFVERTDTDPEQFMRSGSYLYLRSGLIERWNTLNEHHTYPNMIKRLKIN